MLSASRLRPPSQHIRRQLLYTTSQPKEQPENGPEDVREDVQEVVRPAPNILVYQNRGYKRFMVTNTSLQSLVKRSEKAQKHKRIRRENHHLNAFTTRPPAEDEAPFDERAGLNTKVRPSKGSLLLQPHQRLIAVKDNISSSHFPTTCASQMLDGYKSPYNATVLGHLECGGATVIGKTNMDEFGMGSHSIHSKYGAVKRMNPFAKYSAGGSSGGSAVAVASGQCDLALGTDTGGSVRLPAAYNGIIGFKPSYGRFSRWGLVPYANSLDTVGIFCFPERRKTPLLSRNLRPNFFRFMRPEEAIDPDPTLLTRWSRLRLKKSYRDQILNERHNMGSTKRLAAQIRFGVPVEYNTRELSTPVRLAWKTLLEKLQEGGHKIVPISLPSTKHALSAYYIIAAAEAASNLAKYDGVRYGYRCQTSDGADGVLYAKTRGEGFGNEVKRRILLGSYTLSSKAIDNYFLQAQKIRRLVQQDFDRVFALPNDLREQEPINLSEIDENISVEDKTGPAQVDLIICPTAPGLPPRVSQVTTQSFVEAYMNDVFTVPSSLAGLPAISIPVSFTKDTPVGIQVIGQYFDDDFVVEIGERISYCILEKNFERMKHPIDLSSV